MTQYAFYFDSSRCTGCKTCTMACKDYHDLPITTSYRKVYDYEGGDTLIGKDGTVTTNAFMYHLSIGCNHCEDPVCVRVCPTGAMHKDEETGFVLVDKNKCIGCGYCHMACPYNAPKVDRDLGHSVKCDGCIEKIHNGEQPVCVSSCPLRALEFGTVEEMEKLGNRANVHPLPEATITTPCLFIKSSKAVEAGKDMTGFVVNPMEVQ